MNNTSSIMDMVNKLPTQIYFSQLPDRQQSLKYIEWIYQNIPSSKTINQDKLFREVIAKHLRIVSMKIIEPEILLLIALNTITLADFTISSDVLVPKVIHENLDKYDLDIMYRVLAQVITKIPKDLKDRVTGKQKLQLFQLMAKYVKIEPNLLEKFLQIDPSINNKVNTPISMELNSGDYNTLNDQYLRELYKFEQSQPYLNSTSMEYGSLAAKFAEKNKTTKKTSNGNGNGNINAQYVDLDPTLMMGVEDKTLYYFDPSSGTLSEFPMNPNQTPVSLKDLKTVLLSQEVNKGDIQSTLDKLKMPTNPMSTNAPNAATAATATTEGNIFASFGKLFSSNEDVPITTTTLPTPTIGLPDNAPIPPEFLKHLRNMKSRLENSQNNNDYQSLTYDDENNNTTEKHDISDKKKQSDIAMSGRYRSYNGLNNNNSTYQLYLRELQTQSNNADNKYNRFVKNRQYNRDFPDQTHAYRYPERTRKPFNNSPLDRNTTTTIPATTTTRNPTTTMPATTTTRNPSTTIPATTTTRNPTTTSVSGFANMDDNILGNSVIDKIKTTNQSVENIAIGFISILVLLFLAVIIHSIRTNYKSKK